MKQQDVIKALLFMPGQSEEQRLLYETIRTHPWKYSKYFEKAEHFSPLLEFFYSLKKAHEGPLGLIGDLQRYHGWNFEFTAELEDVLYETFDLVKEGSEEHEEILADPWRHVECLSVGGQSFIASDCGVSTF